MKKTNHNNKGIINSKITVEKTLGEVLWEFIEICKNIKLKENNNI